MLIAPTCGARAFQSTLSMRRATDVHSIDSTDGGISIHALHEESDWLSLYTLSSQIAFQSTLSMRRATFQCASFRHPPVISIHALHEESDSKIVGHYRHGSISIHALHEESDNAVGDVNLVNVISIHALHEESDSAAGHFCPLFETQASCLALSISNNTADTTNNMSKTSNWLSVSF